MAPAGAYATTSKNCFETPAELTSAPLAMVRSPVVASRLTLPAGASMIAPLSFSVPPMKLMAPADRRKRQRRARDRIQVELTGGLDDGVRAGVGQEHRRVQRHRQRAEIERAGGLPDDAARCVDNNRTKA